MCGGLVVSISQSWSVPPDGSFPSVTRLINTKLLIYVSQDTQGRRSRMICLALIRRRVARLRSLTGCSENCKHLPRDWIQQVLNCIRQRAKTFKRSLIYYCSLCVRVYLHVSVCVYFFFFSCWTQSKAASSPNWQVKIDPDPTWPPPERPCF